MRVEVVVLVAESFQIFSALCPVVRALRAVAGTKVCFHLSHANCYLTHESCVKSGFNNTCLVIQC